MCPESVVRVRLRAGAPREHCPWSELERAPQRRALHCGEWGPRGSSLNQRVPSVLCPSISLVTFVASHGNKLRSKYRTRSALEDSSLLSGGDFASFLPVRAADAPLQGRLRDLGAVFLSSAKVFSICTRAPTLLGPPGPPWGSQSKLSGPS